MIPVQKFSATSLQDLDKCEILFFLKYVLGYQDPSGDKAAKGTVCHDTLEAIAECEKLKQTGQKTTKHKIFGTLRQKYDIKKLFDKAFSYSKKQNPHLNWTDNDKKESWEFLSTSFGHRLFPDQHKEIIEPERYFKIEIPYDWAKYSYLDGDTIKTASLMISGKIDIVFRDNDNALNYLDYKFGAKPMDWSKFKEYSYEDMYKNIQLCLYYWAIKQLYPKEDIITHIWYPRANKHWEYCFSEEQMDFAMNKVKNSFKRLRSTSKPSPTYRKHCNMCYFRKCSFSELGRKDLSIKPNGSEKFKLVGEEVSACDAMVKFFSCRNVEQVVKGCKNGNS